MGIFDGRYSTFDALMQYQMFLDILERRENMLNSQSLGQEQLPEAESTSQEELYGLTEISGKTSQEILQILAKRKRYMNKLYERCSIESGYRELFDNRQMGKDRWLFDFAKILEVAFWEQSQKEKVLQLLLKTFNVNNPMSAKKHYENMNKNDAYYQYMEHCFGIRQNDSALFWIFMAAMSANIENEMFMFTEYLSEHIKFMVQLEAYLAKIFPDSGFGENMQKYTMNLLKYVMDAMKSGTASVISNIDYLTNPVFSSE